MKCLDFDWQINEFMVYCRSTQLRKKSMKSYEQIFRLFERWCMEAITDKLQLQLKSPEVANFWLHRRFFTNTHPISTNPGIGGGVIFPPNR